MRCRENGEIWGDAGRYRGRLRDHVDRVGAHEQVVRAREEAHVRIRPVGLVARPQPVGRPRPRLAHLAEHRHPAAGVRAGAHQQATAQRAGRIGRGARLARQGHRGGGASSRCHHLREVTPPSSTASRGRGSSASGRAHSARAAWRLLASMLCSEPSVSSTLGGTDRGSSPKSCRGATTRSKADALQGGLWT